MKFASALIITLIIASMGFKSSVARINPECHCYLFQSAGRSHGEFQSPKHPGYYPANIGCILYIFIGAPDELVEVSLSEFDMRPPSKTKRCIDYVRFYLNLDRPEVSITDPWEFESCGQMRSLVQSVFYSRQRVIIMEFHTTGRLGRNYKFRGFKGSFKFLKRSRYKIQGDPIADHPCRYHFYFDSGPKSGFFFSPNYPQNYPPKSSCLYEFFGAKNNRVIVDFQFIKLETSKDRCDPISAGDRIVVYDGDSKPDRILDRYCGRTGSRQVVSHGPKLTVRLFSDDNGREGQGFSGRFQFVNRHTVQPTRIRDDTMRGDGQVSQSTLCSHEFRSTVEHKSGLFQLPQSPYLPNMKCTFTFRGQPGEKVTIDFRLVQLDDANQQWCRSHTGDRIEVYDGMSDAQKWLAVICGQVERQSVMSSGPSLTVKFVADDVTSTVERGFEGKYSFLTDNTITTEMSMTPKDNTEDKLQSSTFPTQNGVGVSTPGSCRHQIISGDEEKTGILNSPGYPNGFKKDIVCYWLFYGKPNERIRIKFLDFSLNKKHDLIGSINIDLLPKDSCAGRDRVQFYKFYYQAAIGQETRNDAPLEYCGDADPQFVMSGQRSRLDMIFHSVSGSRNSARGVRFRYRFVTDFGVSAASAKQDPAKCIFRFYGRTTSNGSFTSPNYPGQYPDDVICNYRFIGHSRQRISISFADFDVAGEPDGSRCQDSMGDYLEASECLGMDYRVSLRKPYIPTKRFCQPPQRGQIYRLDWPSSCLDLRFHSNSMESGRGFFAYFSFHISNEPILEGRKTNNSPALSGTFFLILCFSLRMILTYMMIS